MDKLKIVEATIVWQNEYEYTYVLTLEDEDGNLYETGRDCVSKRNIAKTVLNRGTYPR